MRSVFYSIVIVPIQSFPDFYIPNRPTLDTFCIGNGKMRFGKYTK